MNRRNFTLLLGGAAVAMPFAAHAQPKATPVIGWLSGVSPGPEAARVAAFRQGLSETGYVEGRNVTIEYRWAEGNYERLPAMAANLAGREVDVIAASAITATLAAKSATSTIPIVFSTGADPVRFGLVTNLARPTGNLTGFSILAGQLMPKRLALLSELVPQAAVIALLINPDNAANEGVTEVRDAASARGVRIVILTAGTEGEIDSAFDTLVQQHADAVLVGSDPYFDNRREQPVALASRHAVPALYEWREFVASGGLISYGTSLTAVYRQFGIYVGKILRGAKPADLPVQQPTTFELVINMKTAKSLGLAVPQTLLVAADELIE
jgi:putative ABC transport system substrate-binding protein